MTTAEFVDLLPGESVIPDDSQPSELLYRQICKHVWDVQYGRPDLHSFGPQRADERKPSFARASRVSAQASRDWHNENANSTSKGVWGCSVAEVREAGTRAIDDSETPVTDGDLRSPGHAFVDYRHASKTELKTIKAALLMFALDRKEIQTVDNSDPPPPESADTPSDTPAESF